MEIFLSMGEIAQKPPKDGWSLADGMLMIQTDFTGVT
jgi:hypothetical protein